MAPIFEVAIFKWMKIAKSQESFVCKLACTFTFLLSATAEAQSRPDINRFANSADICEHLAGEWAPEKTKVENRTIERNINKHCGLAKRLQQTLLKKYKGDAGATATLNQYEAVNYFKPHQP